METKVLLLNFINSAGGRTSITIEEPKFDLTEHEVQTAMETIIADKVFENNRGAQLMEIHSAQIVTKHVETLTEG